MNKKIIAFALLGCLLSLTFVMALKPMPSLDMTTITTTANALPWHGWWEKRMCMKADVTNDGVVDSLDFGLIRASYGFDNCNRKNDNCNRKNKWCNKMDVSHSGTVNKLDADLVKVFMGCRY